MATIILDKDGNDITPKAKAEDLEHICEVGGEFDETSVTLQVYSENLDRHEVTELLGVEPTKSWNANEPHPVGNGKSGKQRIVDFGKWYLSTESNTSPISEKFEEIFSACNQDLEVWKKLSSKYELWVTVGAHLGNWNRELNLDVKVLKWLSDRNLQIKIDVYFDLEDEEE